MSDFRPLVETSTSAFERALLRSARHDAPSQGALAKTAAALGVGGALVTTAGNTAAAAGATATAPFWTLLVKPLLAGAAGGLIVAVSAHQLSAPEERPKPVAPLVAAAPNVEAVPLPTTDPSLSHTAFDDSEQRAVSVPKAQVPAPERLPAAPTALRPAPGSLDPSPGFPLASSAIPATSVAPEPAAPNA
ncbi:MAG TPA: hypothetical protein VF103_03200, partial [Polyangiaceae bacterium]